MATHGTQGSVVASSESSAAGAYLSSISADATYCKLGYIRQCPTCQNKNVLCQFVHLYDGSDMDGKLLSVDAIQEKFSELMTPTVHFIHQPGATNFVSHGHQFYGEWTGSVWHINFLGHLPPSLPTHSSHLHVLDIGVDPTSDGKKLIGLFSVERIGPHGCAPRGHDLVGIALTFTDEGKVSEFQLFDSVIADDYYYRHCIDDFAAGVGKDDYYYGHTSTAAPGGQVLPAEVAGTTPQALQHAGCFAAGILVGAAAVSAYLHTSRRVRGEQYRALLLSEGSVSII